MFPSDEEHDEPKPSTSKKVVKKLQKEVAPSTTSKRARERSTEPPAAVKRAKVTSRQLFWSDESDPEDDVTGKKSELINYMTRRVANGYSRQVASLNKGDYYVEVRVFKCDEIEKVPPANRWRQAILTVKTRTDQDTGAWRHLTRCIKEMRENFKGCPPQFIGTLY